VVAHDAIRSTTSTNVYIYIYYTRRWYEFSDRPDIYRRVRPKGRTYGCVDVRVRSRYGRRARFVLITERVEFVGRRPVRSRREAFFCRWLFRSRDSNKNLQIYASFAPQKFFLIDSETVRFERFS